MAETSITLTRRELYERVWAVPLHRLCKEFGLSDRGLAKICARHKIMCQLAESGPKRRMANRPGSLRCRLAHLDRMTRSSRSRSLRLPTPTPRRVGSPIRQKSLTPE